MTITGDAGVDKPQSSVRRSRFFVTSRTRNAVVLASIVIGALLLIVFLGLNLPSVNISLAAPDKNPSNQQLMGDTSSLESGTPLGNEADSPDQSVASKKITSEMYNADPLYLRLRELQATLSSLAAQYTDAHPDMINVKQQIADIKMRLEEKYGRGVAVNAPVASTPEISSKKDQSGPTDARQTSLDSGILKADGTAQVVTDEKMELKETARLLAVLLDCGRVVIGRVQQTINNPRLEDKGFSPPVFESQLRKEFLARTGHDLRNLASAPMPDRAKPLLLRLASFMQKPVQEAQSLINKKGIGFKGFIPATFGTKVAETFSKDAGVTLRQIGPPKAEPRNPDNKPDEQEEQALLTIQKSHPRIGDHIIEQVLPNNAVRVLLPLFYSKACLACHGKPKGQLDISGYMKEGSKEGDLGGAISVTLAPSTSPN